MCGRLARWCCRAHRPVAVFCSCWSCLPRRLCLWSALVRARRWQGLTPGRWPAAPLPPCSLFFCAPALRPALHLSFNPGSPPSPLPPPHRRSAQVATFTADEMRRYEAYRRSDLKKERVKKVLSGISPVFDKMAPSDAYVIAVKGLAKLFVGDVVETAATVAAEWGDRPAGDQGLAAPALQPKHLRVRLVVGGGEGVPVFGWPLGGARLCLPVGWMPGYMAYGLGSGPARGGDEVRHAGVGDWFSHVRVSPLRWSAGCYPDVWVRCPPPSPSVPSHRKRTGGCGGTAPSPPPTGERGRF